MSSLWNSNYMRCIVHIQIRVFLIGAVTVLNNRNPRQVLVVAKLRMGREDWTAQCFDWLVVTE